MSWIGRILGYAAPSDYNPYRAKLGHVTVEAVKTFNALLNTFSQTFSFKHDEALRQDPQFALAMRRDPFLRALLQERLMPLTRWKWSVVPEDATHKEELERAKWYEQVLKATPRFSKQRLYLGHAAWFGRYASQVAFCEDRIAGRKGWRVKQHKPLNGDKLIYHWDGTPCVAINPMAVREYPAADVHYGDDRGRPFLALRKPEFRQQFVIHVHELDDADYTEPEMAGRIEGIGLRDFCYYGAFLRSKMIMWATAFMEKVGTLGLLIFYYPEGNDSARKQAEASAKAASNRNALAIPIPKGADKKSAAAELLPANMTGVQFLVEIISGWWEKHVERLFIGQSMSAGEGSEGTGSTDRANLAKDTKFNLLQFDATGQQESYTSDLLHVLCDLNGDSGWKPRFEYSLPDPEAEAKLGAITKAASIPGAKLKYKAKEVRELVGMSEPGPDDETVGGDDPQPGMGPDGKPLPPGANAGTPGAASPAPTAQPGNPTPATGPQPSSGGVNPPVETPQPTADGEEEQEPHPEAEALVLAMVMAAEEGDEASVDELAELAQDQDALEGMLEDGDAAEEEPASYAAPSTVPYDWSADTTKKGRVMAVGSGKHAGQKLYGKKAEAALRGREKGKDDAPKSKPTGTEQPTTQPTVGTPPTANPKQAKQDAAHAVALKAVTDPAILTPAELESLAEHLKTLPVAKLKKLAGSIYLGGARTKAELAGRLLSYVKTKRWASTPPTLKPEPKPTASPKHEQAAEAIHASLMANVSNVKALVEEAKTLWDARQKISDDMAKAFVEGGAEHGPETQAKVLALDKRLSVAHDAWAKKKREIDKAIQETKTAFKAAIKEHVTTPATPKYRTHGFSAPIYGNAIEGEIAPAQKEALDSAHAFISSVCNWKDFPQYDLIQAKDGRAFALDNGSANPPNVAVGREWSGSSHPPDAPDNVKQRAMDQSGQVTRIHVHELGHLIEYRKPGVRAAALAFLKKRQGSEKPQKLNDVFPGHGYGDDEMGIKDQFDKAFKDSSAYYVGKIYNRPVTEIVSMGVEQLYKNPAKFAEADPEYFKFILGVLLS